MLFTAECICICTWSWVKCVIAVYTDSEIRDQPAQLPRFRRLLTTSVVCVDYIDIQHRS